MQKRRLGKTNMYVNPVGLGCMGFSHAYGIAEDRDTAIQTMKEAHALGYDFYDTAEMKSLLQQNLVLNTREII